MRAATNASCPASRSAAHAGAVRRSCQTTARWIGRPVARSQTSTVSRWFVMPIAATAPAPRPARSSTVRTVEAVVAHRSSGSCSTSPGRGKCWANGSWAEATTRAAASKSRARVDVVPWSMASTYPVTSAPLPLPARAPVAAAAQTLAAAHDSGLRHPHHRCAREPGGWAGGAR